MNPKANVQHPFLDTLPDLAATADAPTDIAQLLIQEYRDFWERLGDDFHQTDDSATREYAAFYVGALKAEYETDIRLTHERTPVEDVRHRYAHAVSTGCCNSMMRWEVAARAGSEVDRGSAVGD